MQSVFLIRPTSLESIVLMALASLLGSGGQLSALSESSITGHYAEARTADIYTGPCFGNSEMNLEGREAVMAWQVDTGTFDGVDLAGLSVVAVVHSDVTLGDVDSEPNDVRSLILVDERADQGQRSALARFAVSMSDGLLQASEPMAVAIDFEIGHHGASRVIAGDHARLETRALHDGDHLCGNEEVFYPPLSTGVEAHPGVTLEHRFSGEALGIRWSSPHKRSSFAGAFRHN